MPSVTGIDRDERSVELARSHPGVGEIEYLVGDFLTFPLEAESFDLITSVAALHHMDAGAALARMRDLLRPGGVLAVIGLARGSSLADLALNVVAVVDDRVLRFAQALRGQPVVGLPPAETYDSPTVWPPPETDRRMRTISERLLPGVRYRRHLLWRYSLVWTRPPTSVSRGLQTAGGARTDRGAAERAGDPRVAVR